MIKFKLFNNFNTKKKIAFIALLILALLFILGKNYISEIVKAPSTKVHLINIAKVAIPLKNLILMRDVDDKIALLKSSGSCVFCDLTQGNFEGNDFKGVDLRYANLSGANLSNTNLSGANLSNTNLSGADLSGATLYGTNLSQTNLTEADLRGANLTKTVLKSAYLTRANLSGANLDGIDLRNADLTGVNLSGLDLSNKDLAGANLTGANLSNTNLQDASLPNTNLSGANLKNANLQYAFLINSNLTGTILSYANLSGTNLHGVDLRNVDLTGVNLSGLDLSNKDLTGTILTHSNLSGVNLDGVDLRNKDLTGVKLSRDSLRNKDLTGVNLSRDSLRNKDLAGANLSGVDLRNIDLTGANLSGLDLSNKDLTGTILTHSNLSGANLKGVDLRNKDLTGTNLSEVDLSNKDLTGTILKDAKKIKISIKNPSNSNLLAVQFINSIEPALNLIEYVNISRYDLSGDVQYLATKKGFLFETKNNETRLVLDLNNNAQFPFFTRSEAGLLGVASKNKLVYVAYSSLDINGLFTLVVDEYSMNFSKVRNIIKISEFHDDHWGGGLVFDQSGQLYLSVGDGRLFSPAQNLNVYLGKILRLDISDLKLEPEIIAYGLRNPFGLTIDSKDRMFIAQCGESTVEAVYLLNDLYSGIPVNFGWPVFEGSMRRLKDPLMFNDVSAPIFEYTNRPGCVADVVYLDDIELLLLADFYGTIRLVKEQKNGEWNLFHEYKQEKFIWGFGLDKKTKKIFIAPNNLELEILVDQVKLNQ
jgi:uncharacterized protein YjbI with pentapeptide repeats